LSNSRLPVLDSQTPGGWTPSILRTPLANARCQFSC
jgi:hypothetical protein